MKNHKIDIKNLQFTSKTQAVFLIKLIVSIIGICIRWSAKICFFIPFQNIRNKNNIFMKTRNLPLLKI